MTNSGPGNVQNNDEMREDIQTDKVRGVSNLDNYQGSNMNLTGWEIESVVDDVLLVEYADTPEDGGEGVVRGGILLPTNVSNNVWRIGRVLIAGPQAVVKSGQYVMFPNDKGIQAKNVNGRKHVVFLNQQRIFGVVKKLT